MSVLPQAQDTFYFYYAEAQLRRCWLTTTTTTATKFFLKGGAGGGGSSTTATAKNRDFISHTAAENSITTRKPCGDMRNSKMAQALTAADA